MSDSTLRSRILATAALPLAFILAGCVTTPVEQTAAGQATPAAVTAPAVQWTTADAVNARKVADSVADWQLANMTNLEEWIRFISRETPNPRGWVKGTFFVGLADYAVATNQPAYLAELEKIAVQEEWQLGARKFHADDHLVGQYYFLLERAGIASADLGPTKAGLDFILANRPTNQMLHPDKQGDTPCADRWCWADALFMSPATFWDAAHRFDNDAYAQFAHEEWVVATELMFDKEESLYYRDSRFFDRRGADGEKLFWSRGNGWVYGGLVNVLRVMDANDPRRAYYVDLFTKMSDRLVELQTETGMWRASLLATSKTPPETSGTGFFTYGLTWGLNEGILSGQKYERAAHAGWDALVRNVNSDGRLGYVQQVGDQPEGVSATDSQFYGNGAMLLAAGQVIRRAQ